MYDPKEIFTEDGLQELENHLYNMKKAIFFLTNNADDLHIGCTDDKQLDVLYAVEDMLDTYKNGDGEKQDED